MTAQLTEFKFERYMSLSIQSLKGKNIITAVHKKHSRLYSQDYADLVT
jgi:hypothetical protein